MPEVKRENQINDFIKELKRLWMFYPSLRFSQIVTLLEDEHFYYDPDDTTLSKIKNLMEGLK